MFFKHEYKIDNNTGEISVAHKVKFSTTISIENVGLKMNVRIKNRLGEIDWEGYCSNTYLEAWLTYAVEYSNKETNLQGPYTMEIDVGTSVITVPISVNVNMADVPFTLQKAVNSNDSLDAGMLVAVKKELENLSSLIRKVILAVGKDLRESPSIVESSDGSQKLCL